MKTPRELLFEKHREALPALDQVRRNALSAISSSHRKSVFSLFPRALRKLWAELVLPYHRAWTGLAAAWIFIFGFGLALSVETTNSSSAPAPLSREMVVALHHQREQLMQLVQMDAPDPVVEPARPKPQPSSWAKPTTSVG